MDSCSHADVRKAVVFAIVDMYRVLGALIPERTNIVEMDRNYVGGHKLLRWIIQCQMDGHKNAGVRKAVVFAIVDMNKVLGVQGYLAYKTPPPP